MYIYIYIHTCSSTEILLKSPTNQQILRKKTCVNSEHSTVFQHIPSLCPQLFLAANPNSKLWVHHWTMIACHGPSWRRFDSSRLCACGSSVLRRPLAECHEGTAVRTEAQHGNAEDPMQGPGDYQVFVHVSMDWSKGKSATKPFYLENNWNIVLSCRVSQKSIPGSLEGKKRNSWNL